MKRLPSMIFAAAMAAALSAVPAVAQQKTPPPSPPMAPFAPGSPDSTQTAQQQKKSWGGGVKCSNGKCKGASSGSDQSSDGYPSFPASALAPDDGSGSTAQQNPFPEAKSEAAQKKADQGNQQPPPAKEPSSSSDQRMAGMNVLGNGSMTDDGTGKPVFNPGLAQKDDKVGNFYLASGDYVGAYSRFKEATTVDPKNAQAVFGLAQAADRLGKRDEAIQNFEVYLAAVHKGHDAKVARKELKRLVAKP